MREKEAQEVYALLKCSNEEYDEALEMAKKRAAGGSSAPAPTGPQKSEKIVLAANALQNLLPTPERPPLQYGFKKPDQLVPGNFSNYAHRANFFVSITVAISPIVYGLVHFLAWSDNFPTPLERLLWRVSSFVVTSSGLMNISMGISFVWLVDHFNSRRFDALAAIMVIFVIPAAHLLASGFLVVESFRQLLFLDPAAYQLPSWSIYWPHLS